MHSSSSHPRSLYTALIFIVVLLTGTATRAQDTSAQPILPLPKIPAATFNITDYGAIPDGTTLDTAAIQKTIDAASAAGGGTVLIPAGKFLSGPLTFASNLNLHLAQNATLLFDNRIASYPKGGRGYQSCFSVTNAHDIEISGPGAIDGQGEPWWTAFHANHSMPHRPYMILLANCTTVLVHEVTLKNSPMFHLVPQHCTNVTIRDLTISAPGDAPNTDAIDPSGWNFLITNCTLDIGDDNVAIKAGGKPGARPSCGNFTITNCTMLQGHGLSVGGQTGAGLDGLYVDNCTFNGTTSGIRLKASRADGGLVQNLHFANLTMTNVEHPIYITSYYPKEPKNPQDDPAQPIPADAPRPIWRDITFSNITITDCPNAGTLWGLPELPISNLTFTNVRISAKDGMKIYFADNVNFVNSQINVLHGDPLILYKAANVTGLAGTSAPASSPSTTSQ
jgi:polygalacturonase